MNLFRALRTVGLYILGKPISLLPMETLFSKQKNAHKFGGGGTKGSLQY